jgi:hypothetical protein
MAEKNQRGGVQQMKRVLSIILCLMVIVLVAGLASATTMQLDQANATITMTIEKKAKISNLVWENDGTILYSGDLADYPDWYVPRVTGSFFVEQNCDVVYYVSVVRPFTSTVDPNYVLVTRMDLNTANDRGDIGGFVISTGSWYNLPGGPSRAFPYNGEGNTKFWLQVWGAVGDQISSQPAGDYEAEFSITVAAADV